MIAVPIGDAQSVGFPEKENGRVFCNQSVRSLERLTAMCAIREAFQLLEQFIEIWIGVANEIGGAPLA